MTAITRIIREIKSIQKTGLENRPENKKPGNRPGFSISEMKTRLFRVTFGFDVAVDQVKVTDNDGHNRCNNTEHADADL
jgi:hypothetical protein